MNINKKLIDTYEFDYNKYMYRPCFVFIWLGKQYLIERTNNLKICFYCSQMFYEGAVT